MRGYVTQSVLLRCPECGSEYARRTPRQRFCSPACSNSHTRVIDSARRRAARLAGTAAGLQSGLKYRVAHRQEARDYYARYYAEHRVEVLERQKRRRMAL